MNRDQVIASNTIAEFVRSRGHELKRAGEKFVTSCCPLTQHKQGHRPVTIYPTTQSWMCHDCKIGGTVIDWFMHEMGVSAADALRSLGGERNGSGLLATLVKTYDYTDESGNLLFQTCRYEPKHFKQRRPDGKGGWIWNLKGVRRVLYRMPKIISAATVAVAEGEKDSDTLANLGFAATCNALGAGKWRDEYSETLRGKNVVIFGDADGPGQSHVDDVVRSLTGVARSLKRVKLPPEFHDVSDYAGSLPASTAAESIAKLIDETPEVSSLNSLVRNNDRELDDFPEPPSDIVFHGLVGDIVRRIEPHTEADSAGLLIQSLTAFGNVIGRNAHMMADGSRHSMNLFSVLVGETSKSRKGTSWAHVLRIFECADKLWAKDCIGNGLSSGEGLIWAVRDAITKRVSVQKRGKRKKRGKGEKKAESTDEFRTITTDAGVGDKRLCVFEGEFAQLLKVMVREGNTISPVVRSAWDSGNLRSMVKNSPARATGAHISIVGHVTRSELRRLLTETESANGFANRFCFLAVRRSKCLPEGGNIASENFNDLVARLHKAIEFARNTAEVTRGEDARELWRICYPTLSEGKLGLLGAVTARAEAQVLRLSALFALLDCKTTIHAEHHRAALALWNYCDRSAQWVFSTATGDPRADRILFALRGACSAGMTKTEISEQVFNRNLSSGALSDALMLLYQSGWASFTKEVTGGAPCERWFAKSKRTNLTK